MGGNEEEKGVTERKIVSGIMLTLLLASVLIVAYRVTPVKAQVVMVGPIEIFAVRVDWWNVTMHGPRKYGGLDVTNITMDLAVFTNMSLTSLNGSVAYLPNANATKLIVYTTLISSSPRLEIHGYDTVPPFYASPHYFVLFNVHMNAVYVQAENFSPIPTWLPPIPSDVNSDGIVDIHDIGICTKAFGSHPGEPRWKPEADINQDGIIDIYDLVLIAVNFGKTL